MPTIRRIITGLAISTTLAGGLVGLSVATSATAASAGVTGVFDGDSFGSLGLLGLLGGSSDAHNADFSRTFINSFERQNAVQDF